MRIQVSIAFLVVFVGAAPAVHAATGLASLEGLLPFYIAAFSAFLIGFYVFPAWLTFRAKKIHAERGLSNAKLLLLIAPAGLMGVLGVIDYLGLGFVSGIVHGVTGGFGAYWVFLALSALLVYLAGSAYQQCKRLPAGP